MHRFAYKGKYLCCEETPVWRVALQVGTPFYLYSIGTFMDHFFKLKKAFSPVDPLICFSTKANSNLTVLKALVNQGSGLDIVSRGELFRAKKVGVDPAKVVFASVGKTELEIEEAIRFGILMFNVETLQELDVINAVARRLKVAQKVAIRLNPDVAPDTHHYMTTGTQQNKFGIDMETASKLFADSDSYPFLQLSGVHIHIGSQITNSRPFVKAVRKALAFIDRARSAGCSSIETLNIGGGLGIVYSKEKPQTAQEFADAILPILQRYRRRHPLKIILEPGRFISGNSGILVTQVLYEKRTPSKAFLIVDGGMNDLIRPALYGAYHEILPVVKKTARTRYAKVDIVGPVCESGDFLAKERSLPTVNAGDLLAVMSCGAYGYVMSSNYNSRPRVPEVVVKGSRFFVAKRRERLSDLVRQERIVTEVV